MISKKEKMFSANFIKRVLIFIIGLFIMALGVSLSVKADIGVSPISCVPYIYSLKLPFSIGEITIILNIVFILFQMMVLKQNYKIIQLVQLPSVVVFGYCIDATMAFINNLIPTNYIEQLLLCVIACIVLAFGIFLVVKTHLTCLPLEGLVIAISQTYEKEFGKIKITMDSLMVVIGTISSFLLLSSLEGIREGSIIAALSIGAIIKFYSIKMPFIEAWLMGQKDKEISYKEKDDKYENTFVITISREFGSGGHEIGKYIAKALGLEFYDKDLIRLTAKQTGYTLDYIKENEQKLTSSLLYELYEQNYNYISDELPPKDALFLVQSKIIREICAKKSCVIVGRCANFILKDHPNCINIFIHANKKYRKDKVNNEYRIKDLVSDKDLEELDEERANYCSHFTKKEWRNAKNYHICIDSSLYGSQKSANKILELIK